MGLRFRRSFRIIPGVRLNLSKSGVSTSIGRRGAWFTIGPRGTRSTIGIPGTGISYTEQHRRAATPDEEPVAALAQPIRKTPPAQAVAWFVGILVTVIALVVAIVYLGVTL